MRYQAVIFDLFWTLTSLESIGATGPRLCDEMGVPAERWDPLWLQHEDGRARGRYGSTAEVLASIAAELGLVPDPEHLNALAVDRRERFRRALVEIEPQVLTGLEQLRALGPRLGLLSDADCDEVAAWPDSPLRPYFDVAFFSCHAGLRKPDPVFYLRLCEKLAVDPRHCLYVGDGRSDEHIGARAVGMTPVLMTAHLSRYSPERIALMTPRCDHVVASVGDVVQLVREA